MKFVSVGGEMIEKENKLVRTYSFSSDGRCISSLWWK